MWIGVTERQHENVMSWHMDNKIDDVQFEIRDCCQKPFFERED